MKKRGDTMSLRIDGKKISSDIKEELKEQVKQYRIQKVRSYARMENRSRLIIFLHQQAGQAQMRYGEQTGQQLI